MLRTSAAILVTAALAGTAVAQTNPAPSSATMPMAGSPASATSTAFITDQPVGQYRASKLVGVDVYGSDSQKIGDVNEVLFDATGQLKAVVIGVGGFLGIGEKNVAVPFTALEWVEARTPAMTSANNSPAVPTAGAPTVSPAATTDTTGSTAPVAPTTTVAPVSTRSPAETAAYNGYPDHAMLRMSKADLQNAPSFKYYAETHSAAERPAGAAPATRP